MNLQRYIQPVAMAWAEALQQVNPVLESDDVRSEIQRLTERILVLLEEERLEPAAAEAIGMRLEELDSFQPGDLQVTQAALFDAFAERLTRAEWEKLQRKVACLLFSLGAGFFAGKAQRASRFEMDAMSRMGHDLKTPVNAITGFSRVILKGIDGPITDFQREDLISIYEAGQKLLAMIDDLFSIRKLDAARTLIYSAPFEVSDLLADVVRTIQPMVADEHREFELRMAGSLGTMSLDASRVRWVLLGLLSATVRHTRNGLIRLVVSRDGDDRSRIKFEVIHLSRGGTASFTGVSGQEMTDASIWQDDMVLGTCRRFCEQMDGTLAMSVEDVTSFTVRLPADPQRAF
ncbi:MAG: sensor histidine kinase [Anaerolineae bacterium]